MIVNFLRGLKKMKNKKEYWVKIEGEDVVVQGNFEESVKWENRWKVKTLNEVRNILSVFFEEESEEVVDGMKSIFIFKQELL